MNLLSIFNRKNSAPVARDRLQILLAHERSNGEGQSDLITKLREEIIAVISKHVAIDQDKVQIKLDRGASVSTLEIDVEVPALKLSTRAADRPTPQTAPGQAASGQAASG